MGYLVKFSRKAEKSFKKIPQFARVKIETALKSFAGNSYGHHDVVRIKGSPKEITSYRIRAGGYRASFVIWHDVMIVFVFNIGKKENYDYR
jgi:mRNA-degrading endonuclease RelE of RelBE toxin-antitoxin system